MPPLMENLSAVPAWTDLNVQTSMETRVLALQPIPNPLITGLKPKRKAHSYARTLPLKNACLSLQVACLTSLGWDVMLSDTIPTEALEDGVLTLMMSKGTNHLPSHLAKLACIACPSQSLESTESLFRDGIFISKDECTLRSHLCHSLAALRAPYALENKPLPARRILSLIWPMLSPSPTSDLVAPPMPPEYHPQAPVNWLVQDFLNRMCSNSDVNVLQPLSFHEWVARYPENRRKMLTEAYHQVVSQDGLTRKDAIVKCFLKMETSTKLTDPRNISPRSDSFLSVIGPRISAIEKHLHHAPFLVKGLDLQKRDEKMRGLLDFDTYVETDYSRFDMTISYDWIQCVQDRLLLAFFPDDVMFKQALELARHTKGVSGNGMKYSILGTRCSGDAHTSIANGLINAFNTQILFRDLIVSPHCVEIEGVAEEGVMASWHEGDDGVIAFTKSAAVHCNRLDSLDSFGFVVKSFVTRDLNLVSFCGRFLSTDGTSLLSYCDPLRSLSKLHITLSLGRLDRLLFAKMMSYAHTDGRTPVIGPVASTIAKAYEHLYGKRAVQMALGDRFLYRDLVDVKFNWRDATVDERLRVPFAMRTGISPAVQKQYEEYYVRCFSDHMITDFVKLKSADDIITGAADREVFFMPTQHVL